jgi:putative membrane protein
MQTIIDRQQSKNYKPLIWTLTIAINALIAIAFFLPDIEVLKKYDFSFLPLLNAILNSLTFISLTVALFAIRQKNIKRHKTFVLLALFWTSIFLVSYLLYHFSTPSTKFGGEGFIKYIYLFILLTHIFLAAIIVPLALISIGRGLNMEVEKHKKIARWTMPIWLYVSLTGVIVYLMISPYY